MTDYIHCWYGEPVNEMPREKLLEIIDFLGEELRVLNSSENIHARALGRVEMMKGK